MRLALAEARKGLGRTFPNPAVGAVIVAEGKIVGRGFHAAAGEAHAEVVALKRAGVRAKGAVLYTTLEPCNHTGRTGPCSVAILEAGVARVVFASADPNPLVRGKGVARLRRAGVGVEGGVLADEADAMNRAYLKHMRTGLPYVTLKAAVTLDGKLATRSGDSRWVTGPEARERVHRLRNEADVILVGAGTALADDPLLTTRLPEGEPSRDPLRVVVDGKLRIPPTLQMFAQPSNAGTVVATCAVGKGARAAALAEAGADVWHLPSSRQSGRLSLRRLLEQLGAMGHSHVLVEGGADIHAGFLKEDLADELWLFVAPKVVGGDGLGWLGALGLREMQKARVLHGCSVEPCGSDLLIRGHWTP